MEHKDHDKVFFVNFAMVLGALFGIFFICVLAARLLVGGGMRDEGEDAARLEDRIRPVGTVVTDPSALVKVAVAAPVRAPYTGADVAARVCNACHLAAVLGAPKNGDTAAWDARKQAAGGLDGLVASAIKGKNAMPPRGGAVDLTDDELRAAIEQLMKQPGV